MRPAQTYTFAHAYLGLVLLFGCATAPEDSGAPGGDGLMEAIAGLPACAPVVDDGRIDLVLGCVDEMCVGTSYATAIDTIGVEPTCTAQVDDASLLDCHWDQQIWTTVADLDLDGRPDEDYFLQEIAIRNGFEAGTNEGLGVGASTSCFVDLFSLPERMIWEKTSEGYALTDAEWLGWGLRTLDNDGPPGSLVPDGVVDELVFSGAR
jgi:hypothetical protein